MNNGCVPPTASHFNQVSCSGKKHSSQSSQPILFAPRGRRTSIIFIIIIIILYKLFPDPVYEGKKLNFL